MDVRRTGLQRMRWLGGVGVFPVIAIWFAFNETHARDTLRTVILFAIPLAFLLTVELCAQAASRLAGGDARNLIWLGACSGPVIWWVPVALLLVFMRQPVGPAVPVLLMTGAYAFGWGAIVGFCAAGIIKLRN